MGVPIAITLHYDNTSKPRRVTRVSDTTGRDILWFEYNAEDQVKQVRDNVDPNQGRKVQYAYTGGYELSSYTDVRGQTWHYSYVFFPTSTAGTYGAALQMYDGRLELPIILTQIKDPQGHTTHIEYTKQRQVAKISYPGGRTTNYVYDYDKTRNILRHPPYEMNYSAETKKKA